MHSTIDVFRKQDPGNEGVWYVHMWLVDMWLVHIRHALRCIVVCAVLCVAVLTLTGHNLVHGHQTGSSNCSGRMPQETKVVHVVGYL